ncbi:hypothetical protein LTR99_011054 [Exophiala xenobiotica]|uniref:Uncharacterized protein n=1 Tax=Vermiconidia calcicola TaxID=1690605 RepID=A0AAV9PQU1_9PEZI|nr:hypothetical protein LTR92_010997 [Exophiala xenobiotica]KAK5527625.1 hypothetical protein LTR25_011040 [Vermiconidia calcicola]KAK5528074.1 hypothetical protein LTR23_011134 [Chaetothyriales sp. CCFEE 6169]KAK5290567.1 hypothetical protein LTR99_011054 [Exophiala xenobiotica]KAK5313018.1 hypothetical protein LTR93_011085 [Exophiala xenobiotica]
MASDYCLPKEQHTVFSLDSSPLPARCGTKKEKVFIRGTMNSARERDSYDVFDGLAYNSSSQGRKNDVHIYDDEDSRYGYGDRKEDRCARPGSYYKHEQNVDEQSYRSRTVYSSQSAPTRQATEADTVGAGIPAGYSIKHWDQTEEPIILLGSVFDANSLGKWFYDWTAFHHGASTPMADMAGELWLLLIKLAGKIKRAEECVDRIRNPDKRETVEDFILRGRRIWNKFKHLSKDGEYPMLKVIKRNDAGKMAKEGAIELLDTIFGRHRHLEKTEQIMNRIRLWTANFDLDCEETIKTVAKYQRPST